MKRTGIPEIDDHPGEFVIGSDEVGYGAWAGPLVVVAVATPRDWEDSRVKDSKKLSEKAREALYREFFQADFPMYVAIVEPADIDRRSVWTALIRAHEEAIMGVVALLLPIPGKKLVIVDGNVPTEVGFSLPKADDLVPAVSLASIIAKVTRDRMMVKLADEFPGYGFARHKGYGTPEHTTALGELGPCSAHRMSYSPVSAAKAKLTEQESEDIFDMIEDCT